MPVGRTSEVNYDNIAQQSDATLLVNCTPAGMFPHCPAAPCTLEGLDALEGVIDIVYNPARTGLMLEAERRGIPCIGGLLMLVAQGRNAKYIEQALSISLSTAQTHIRNIYRKTGVHSRQELLDLIEGTKLYGEE